MRVQFSNNDKEILEARKKKNENYEGIIIPTELQDKEITVSLKISDVHKLNLFMEKIIEDQSDTNEICDTIGANIIRIDYRPVIKEEDIITVRNIIDQILFGYREEPQENISKNQSEVVSETIPIDQMPDGLVNEVIEEDEGDNDDCDFNEYGQNEY